MALKARFIVDTSAAARMRHAAVRAGVPGGSRPSLGRFSPPGREERDWEAAFDAQEELSRTGHHDAVGIADLITGVVAVRHGLVVVHYDSDFDTVSKVTGLRQRWVVPRESVP